jgi:predicted Fe-Mo cluster-binding NifX family protein
MRIAVTAQGTDLDSAMDPRFGRCRSFVIADSDSEEFEAFSNDGVMASGGAGTQSAQFLANKGVDAVITGNVGPNAARALEAAGIEVYSTAAGTVRDALQAFKAGKLSAVSGATVDSHHGMGRL